MSGYTPVFGSVFQGSLCGKFPDLPLWLVLLAMADKNGHVDASPAYIALVSGIPVDQVEQCLVRFCEPDPNSRTPEHDGRRLEPLEGRGFGWRIVNHSKYREKARKAAYDAERVASGENRERLAARRAQAQQDDPTRPDATRAHPLSDSDADTDSDSDSEVGEGGANAPKPAARKKLATRIPEGWRPTPELVAYAEQHLPGVDVEALLEEFVDYWTAAAGERARKADWAATWRTWVRRSDRRYPMKPQAPAAPRRVPKFDMHGRPLDA